MRRVYLLSASRALCHDIVFLSRVNAQQWCPHKDQALHSIGSFRPFLLALFFSFFFFSFCQLTIHSRALRLSVCASFNKLLMKKNLTPLAQRHVFSRSSQYPHGERMFEKACANPRRESYTSGSHTPSVA